MFTERVTVLVGHFGSGKTEIAVNGALALSAAGRPSALVDLDVIKPYFRSRSAREFMAEAGVELVAPQGDNLFADLPILVPRVRALCRDPDRFVILDAGGDDTGARALGSMSDLLAASGVGITLVLNFRRPFTPDVATAVVMAREIEAAARLPVTGVVSNTHLMNETTVAVVREGYDLAVATARDLGVPVRAVAADEGIADAVRAAVDGCEVFALHRLLRTPFDPELRVRKTGPIFQLN
jgi:Mrp family chromosome partitioning ATPase